MYPEALNDLARMLAAAASDRLRNGAEAIALAERAWQLTQFQQPMFIGTLAAADAEAGRFDDAVKTAEKAKDLAAAAGLKDVAEGTADCSNCTGPEDLSMRRGSSGLVAVSRQLLSRGWIKEDWKAPPPPQLRFRAGVSFPQAL